MKRMLPLAICFGMAAGGCRSADPVSQWMSQGPQNQAIAENAPQSPQNSHPGFPAGNTRGKQVQGSQEERIKLGQTEVFNWYQDRQNRHLETARAHFESVLAQSPQNPRAHHGLAIVSDLEKNYADAERHYLMALAQNPHDSDLLGDLGYSYLLQDRLAESEQYSLRAVEANSGNKKALKHLADAYARQGKTQQAQEIYAQVLPQSDISKALADNAPQSQPAESNTESSSLFDKLFTRKSAGEKLAEEVVRRQQELARQQALERSQRSFAARAHDSSRMRQDEILKERLAAIDQEGYPNNPNGAILIDDQDGSMTRLPGADTNPNWNQQGAVAAANFPATVVQAPASAIPRDGVSGPSSFSNVADGAQQAPPRNEWPREAPAGAASNSPVPQGHTGRDGWSEPSAIAAYGNQSSGMQPWTGLQPVSATPDAEMRIDQAYGQVSPAAAQQTIMGANGQMPASGPRAFQGAPNYGQYPVQSQGMTPPDFATAAAARQSQIRNGQQPPISGMPGTYGQPVMNQPGAPQQQSQYQMASQGMRQPAMDQAVQNRFQQSSSPAVQPGLPPVSQQAQQAQQASDAYRDASNAAARMGMGLGSGSMFPVFNQAAAVSPPGSMSYQNSNPPPVMRYMPDAVEPPDLRNAFVPDEKQIIPPAYTQGGQMPPVTVPMKTREQYGTATRYDAQTLQSSNIPPNWWQTMQPYEAQRWDAGQQANHAVQQIWAQGPMNMAVNPSSGSQYFHPNATGPTYTPNPPQGLNGLQPPMWPHHQQAVPISQIDPDVSMTPQVLQDSRIEPKSDAQQAVDTALANGYQPTGSTPNSYQSDAYGYPRSMTPAPANTRGQTVYPAGGNSMQNSPANGYQGMGVQPAAYGPPAGGNDMVTPPTYRQEAPRPATDRPRVSANNSRQNAPTPATDDAVWPVIRPASR